MDDGSSSDSSDGGRVSIRPVINQDPSSMNNDASKEIGNCAQSNEKETTNETPKTNEIEGVKKTTHDDGSGGSVRLEDRFEEDPQSPHERELSKGTIPDDQSVASPVEEERYEEEESDYSEPSSAEKRRKRKRAAKQKKKLAVIKAPKVLKQRRPKKHLSDSEDDAFTLRVAKMKPSSYRSSRDKSKKGNYADDEVMYGIESEEEVGLAEKQQPLIENILGSKKSEEKGLVYLVKWREKSYLHCEWVSQAMIEEDVNGATRFKRFQNSEQSKINETTDYFDPSFVEIERIIDSTQGIHETSKDRWKREAAQILSKLKNLRRNNFKVASFFMQPVDEQLDGATDYYTIIEHPMDLGKISNNLVEGSVYETPEAFATDVRLVFSNCERFNPIETDFVRQCCTWLKEVFEERYANLLDAVEKQNEMVQNAEVPRYLVKWKGLSYAEATWEDETDIPDDELIAAYYRRNVIPKFKHQSKGVPFVKYTASPTFKDGLTLRSYQVEGLNWLAFNHANGRGCILADEMGLGKTCQTVSLVQHLNIRGNIDNRPCLIVAPLSTLGHWKSEFERWTDLNCVMYHDSGSRFKNGAETRAFIREEEFYYWQEQSGVQVMVPGQFKFKVLITSYEVLCTDAEFLSDIPFAAVVVDEGQRLKTTKSKLANTFRDYIHSDIRFLLSGTPLQNNVSELWALLNFVQQDEFPSEEQFLSEFGDLQKADQVKNLQNRIKPFMLRRLKEDVEKDIPAKEETVIDVELTTMQKKYYRAIFERNRAFLRGNSKNSAEAQLVNIEMELRKCCNHPFLINGVEDLNSDANQLERIIEASGKMVLLDKLLAKLRSEKRKVLIFSQFTIMLDIIMDYCLLKAYPMERIDGNVARADRQSSIDRFGMDHHSFIFLLSTRAGGVGINLTAADTVIIFDSDWNPQNDLQAMARCHRIGQKKSVMVYRFVTKNTYEAKLFECAARKLGLEQAVLGKGGTQSDTRSKEEIEGLLKHGAYRLLEDDTEADQRSKQYCEADIEDLLKRDSRKVNWDENSNRNDSTLNFSKASFVAAGTDQEIDVADPSFWTKVLGDDPRTTLVSRLVDKSATESVETRRSFFDELVRYGNEIIKEKLGGDPHPPYEENVYDCLLQIKNMPRSFSKEERETSDDFMKQIERPSRRLEKKIQFYQGQNPEDVEVVGEKKEDNLSSSDSSDSEANQVDQVTIGNRKVSIPELKRAVSSHGGIATVRKDDSWSALRLELALPKTPKVMTDLIAAATKLCPVPRKKKLAKKNASVKKKKAVKKAVSSSSEDERPAKRKVVTSQKAYLDRVKVEILPQDVYDKLVAEDLPWCRYCGATDTSGWSRGPWGSKKLCIPHYVAWWQKKTLDLSQWEDDEPTYPVHPEENTMFKFKAWKQYKENSIKEQGEISSIKSSKYESKSPYFRDFASTSSRRRQPIVESPSED